jgi:hypothetical protein
MQSKSTEKEKKDVLLRTDEQRTASREQMRQEFAELTRPDTDQCAHKQSRSQREQV